MLDGPWFLGCFWLTVLTIVQLLLFTTLKFNLYGNYEDVKSLSCLLMTEERRKDEEKSTETHAQEKALQ